MNREIKFRAWCPKNKEMYYDDGNYRFHIFQDCIGYYPEYNKEEFYHFNTNPSKDELKMDVMQYTGLKGYEGDIADVCIFLVSPENPDNDQYFRGVIEFENGMFVFVIHKYLKFDGNKSEWVDIQSRYLPFYDEELDEDGTYTIPYFSFLAMSSNLGEFCDDNVEIIGNIYQHPDLLQ